MLRYTRILCMLLILITLVTGCGTGNKSEQDLESQTTIENRFEEKTENEADNKEVIRESSGQFSSGYLDVNKDVYEYNGKEVEIPFYLENQGNKNEGAETIGLLLFVDKELNETDTVDVSKLAKERKNEDFLMANFTVSPDGVKIAWDTGESILCYDRKTKQFAEYNQFTEKDIVTENIIFAGNDKLGVYGSKGESEEDTCYGYLNLTDKKVHLFVEKKYEAFSLKADKRYIWLNDGENPEDKTASGKMPIVDTKTGKNQLVHLDNIESTKASITEDLQSV